MIILKKILSVVLCSALLVPEFGNYRLALGQIETSLTQTQVATAAWQTFFQRSPLLREETGLTDAEILKTCRLLALDRGFRIEGLDNVRAKLTPKGQLEKIQERLAALAKIQSGRAAELQQQPGIDLSEADRTRQALQDFQDIQPKLLPHLDSAEAKQLDARREGLETLLTDRTGKTLAELQAAWRQNIAGAAVAPQATEAAGAPQSVDSLAVKPETVLQPSSLSSQETSRSETPPAPAQPTIVEPEKEAIPRGHIWTPANSPIFIFLKQLDSVFFGGEKFDRVQFTTIHDIPDTLGKLLDLSQETLGSYYNFAHPRLLDAILKAGREGRANRWVGDRSNTFPPSGGRQRRPEIQGLIDHLSKNLLLRILQGRGRFGSNHSKTMVLKDKSGKKIIQKGAANYTVYAQEDQFNDSVLTDDEDQVDFYERVFGWQWGLARDFTETLTPEPANVDPASVPKVRRLTREFHGEQFPSDIMSPLGGMMDELVRATRLAVESMLLAMFSLSPSKILFDEMISFLSRAKDPDPMRVILDPSQLPNSPAVLTLMDHHAQIGLLTGTDEAPYNPANSHRLFSMMHLKTWLWDKKFLKGFNSAQATTNGDQGNFDNTSFWTGVYADIYREMLEWMWTLAYKPTRQELEQKIHRNKSDMAPGSTIEIPDYDSGGK